MSPFNRRQFLKSGVATVAVATSPVGAPESIAAADLLIVQYDQDRWSWKPKLMAMIARLLVALFVTMAISAVGAAQLPYAGTNDALKAISSATNTAAQRCGVVTPGDAPCLYFTINAAACAAADGYLIVTLNDGGCATAGLSGDIDVRNEGAVPCAAALCVSGDADNAPAFDRMAAFVETHGGCGLVSNTTYPYKITVSSVASLDGTGAMLVEQHGNCLHGILAGSEGQGGNSLGTSELQTPNCVDGASQYDNGSRPREDDWRLYDLTITSLCAGSTTTSATEVSGLHLGYGTGYDVHNVTFKNWVRCRWFEANGTGQDYSSRVQCINQNYIPNRINGYPEYGTLVYSTGSGQIQFHIDQATTDFPGNELTQSYTLPNGTGGAYTGQITLPAGYGYLHGTYGIQVYVNGVRDANLGTDYVLTDGTSGAPDTAIYGRLDTSTLSPSNTAVTLSSAAGLPTSIVADSTGPPWCQYSPVIGVFGEGIEPQTCITAISGTSVTLSKAVQPSVGALQQILYEQLFIADRESGCGVNRASPSASTSNCGHVINIVFQSGHYPGNGVSVRATYNDPWADACLAILRGAADDNWEGYSAGGCRYGAVVETARQKVDLRYIQIAYASSYVYQPGGGEIKISNSSPSTVMVAPGYPTPGSAGTSGRWIRCFAGNCTSQIEQATYVRNSYYGPGGGQLAGGGAAVAATDTLYLHPWFVKGGTNSGSGSSMANLGVQQFSIDATAAGTGASVTFCLYAPNQAGDGPGTLLTGSGSVSISGTGDIRSGAVPNVYLHPGIVWVGTMYSFSAAPSIAQVNSDPTLSQAIKGATGATTALTAGLYNGVYYNQSGLYNAGCPLSLAGLTTATNSASIPIPEIAIDAY